MTAEGESDKRKLHRAYWYGLRDDPQKEIMITSAFNDMHWAARHQNGGSAGLLAKTAGRRYDASAKGSLKHSRSPGARAANMAHYNKKSVVLPVYPTI